jgi:restriction endonuclease S subunit
LRLVSTSPSASEWPKRPVATVAEVFLGLADGRLRRDAGEREVPLLNVRDLQDGRVPPRDAVAKRSVPVDADIERYTVRAGDVVVTCRGTQLKIATITPASEGSLISANLIALRAGREMQPAVLLVFLQSPAGHKALLQRGQSSSLSLSLTPRAVGELLIPVPPLAVQQQIAELVGAAEQNYVAAIRAAEQRRAVARAVAVGLLQGATPSGREERA